MSLILEALKKSEQQRQREKAPNLQSIHQPTAIAATKKTPPWWIFAAIIVICNIAFFGYWFWRQQTMPPLAQTSPPLAQTTPAASTTSAVNNEQSESSATAATTAKSTDAPQAQPEFTQISPRGSSIQSQPTDAAQRVEEISELPDNVRNNLPAMTFSFHVYSEAPEQRTIIINDRRMREGDEVSAGLKLQSITTDGVILLFQQHRVHISVLSDW